jgi:riboflavin-specific deaminase-like protein
MLTLQRLLPAPLAKVDPYDAYRPPHRGPLLRINMVASADGLVTDPKGRAGGLAGEADRRVFRVLRALADAILVGAGTVRAEGYGPHRLTPDLAERRRSEGRDGPAPIVVVSRSLDFDFEAPLFTEATARTIVLTCEASDLARRTAAARVAHVLVVGDRTVELAAAVGALGSELGLDHLVCEGGPTLNAPLLAAGLVDELCLTLSPAIMGTGGPAIVEALPAPVALTLHGLYEHHSELFVRYGPRRDVVPQTSGGLVRS